MGITCGTIPLGLPLIFFKDVGGQVELVVSDTVLALLLIGPGPTLVSHLALMQVGAVKVGEDGGDGAAVSVVDQ